MLPDTRPGVSIKSDGICVGCHNARSKGELDWGARRDAFVEVVANTKKRSASSAYDCVIPVSGGKDSYWQVVTCLEHGLTPLCVTYAYPGRTELGQRNLRNLVGLGVDHVEFRLNPTVERTLVERSFRTTGISGLVTHMAIYAYPVRVAVEQNIPLVIYGENSAFEYGTEDESLVGARVDRRWLRQFGVTAGTVAADWVADDISARQLSALTLPDEAVLADNEVRVVFLGYYMPWDPINSYRIASANGFQARSEGARVGHYDFVNIDDDMIGVHHHPKWHKYGITRTWDTVSMEIRSGRMSRAEAIGVIRAAGDETPHDDIAVFCEYLGITTAEYFHIVEGFRNQQLWSRHQDRWIIEDFLIPDFPWADDSPASGAAP